MGLTANSLFLAVSSRLFDLLIVLCPGSAKYMFSAVVGVVARRS